MKTLLVTYRDGSTAPFSIPDEIEYTGDLLWMPPDDQRRGGDEPDLYWEISDDERQLDFWIRGADIRSLVLIHEGNVMIDPNQLARQTLEQTDA